MKNLNRIFEEVLREESTNIGTDGWDTDEDDWDGEDPNFGSLKNLKKQSPRKINPNHVKSEK